MPIYYNRKRQNACFKVGTRGYITLIKSLGHNTSWESLESSESIHKLPLSNKPVIFYTLGIPLHFACKPTTLI